MGENDNLNTKKDGFTHEGVYGEMDVKGYERMEARGMRFRKSGYAKTRVYANMKKPKDFRECDCTGTRSYGNMEKWEKGEMDR